MSDLRELLARARYGLGAFAHPPEEGNRAWLATLLAEIDAALAGVTVDWRETRVGRPRRTHYQAHFARFGATVFHHTGGGWEWRLSAVGTATTLAAAKLAAERAAGVK